MKGIIFRAFIDHVEDQFGLAEVERMLENSDLPNGGAYTSVGTYDPSELVQMLGNLAEQTGSEIPTILKGFGEYLFRGLASSYPEAISHASDAFSLISSIDNHIHVEVRKLYPDADLPKFTYELAGPDEMTLTYESSRGLADLAEGLLRGCFDHFGETVDLEREDLSGGKLTHVQFVLNRRCRGDG